MELRHRENEWRLLGFRRRQFRRPQRGGARASGQLSQVGSLERPSLELNGHQTVETTVEKQQVNILAHAKGVEVVLVAHEREAPTKRHDELLDVLDYALLGARGVKN